MNWITNYILFTYIMWLFMHQIENHVLINALKNTQTGTKTSLGKKASGNASSTRCFSVFKYLIDEKILRLQVAMKNLFAVTKRQTAEQLEPVENGSEIGSQSEGRADHPNRQGPVSVQICYRLLTKISGCIDRRIDRVTQTDCTSLFGRRLWIRGCRLTARVRRSRYKLNAKNTNSAK